MKARNIILATVLTIISGQTFANDSSTTNVSAASKHSALAASHGALASVKVGSAVAATPLIIVGTVGEASKQIGVKLINNAVGNKPLEVTDKTITAAPSPAEMMKKSAEKER